MWAHSTATFLSYNHSSNDRLSVECEFVKYRKLFYPVYWAHNSKSVQAFFCSYWSISSTQCADNSIVNLDYDGEESWTNPNEKNASAFNQLGLLDTKHDEEFQRPIPSDLIMAFEHTVHLELSLQSISYLILLLEQSHVLPLVEQLRVTFEYYNVNPMIGPNNQYQRRQCHRSLRLLSLRHASVSNVILLLSDFSWATLEELSLIDIHDKSIAINIDYMSYAFFFD